MKKKIVGIFICIILIVSSLLVVVNIVLLANHNPFAFTSNNGIDQIRTNHGVILDQYLNSGEQGYTVLCVWGSYYEMGFAHAKLLGDYIVQGIYEIKSLLGTEYNYIKTSLIDSVWMPPEIEDELDGMVDSLAITHPLACIDKMDLKVINTAGDWLYDYACRSHSCWGRYVTDPIKTLSTRRLDFETFIPTLNHHLLCVYIPDDGSLKWMNFAFPGIVVVMTGVNEYGTLASIHDWEPMEWPDLSSDRMSRLVAIRYALTYPTDPNLSTHLSSVYTELQNYESMSMSFLNYYVPEGNGGIMTCNPWQSGLDIYDLRLPQSDWHHGEAIITTNKWTSGTYTPYDEDFGADVYYNDETPKTPESHWGLLDSSSDFENLHNFHVTYRDHGDMTIWADGRLDGVGRTPRLEYEWSDLFDSTVPSSPDINGSISGEVGLSYDYEFSIIDPDGDDVYYYVDWGDGAYDDWFGPYASGATGIVSHIWAIKGSYTITAYAKDSIGFIGPEATLSITIL